MDNDLLDTIKKFTEITKNEKKEEVSSKKNLNNTNNNKVNEIKKEEINQQDNLYKSISQKFKYGYQIIFTNPNEDGLIESFLNDSNGENKQNNDISDYFNYGLDEEKWRKILNYSILMHYKRHLKEEKRKNEKKNVENTLGYQFPISDNMMQNRNNFFGLNNPYYNNYMMYMQMRNNPMYNNMNMINNTMMNNPMINNPMMNNPMMNNNINK